MNNRMIRYNFFESPLIAKFTTEVKLLLLGLIARADDRGNGYLDILQIRAYIFPRDNDITDDDLLIMFKTLEDSDRICKYIDNEDSFYHIIGWRKPGAPVYQKLDKPKPNTEIPLCPEYLSDQYIGKIDNTIDETGNIIHIQNHADSEWTPNGLKMDPQVKREEERISKKNLTEAADSDDNPHRYISSEFINNKVLPKYENFDCIQSVLSRFNQWIDQNPGKIKHYEKNFLEWCNEDCPVL